MAQRQAASAQPGGTSDVDDECQRALEAAMGVAMEHCVPEDQLNQNIGRMLGVEPDVDCEAALTEGLDAATCGDSRGVRQWVLCSAQRRIMRDEITFSEAMEAAWDEAKQECRAEGHPI